MRNALVTKDFVKKRKITMKTTDGFIEKSL